VIHDGGQETPAPNTYFLVNAFEPTTLDLGQMDVDHIEGIRFSIGVDSASNHLDPAQYEADHPLAYHNPSMHWGWIAGYRFIAYEGKSGNGLLYIFQIHTIGNDLYRTVNLATGAETDGDTRVIPLAADYGQLLVDIDVSGGLYAHGNLNEARTASDNMADFVFQALLSSNKLPSREDVGMMLWPNPATDRHATVGLDLPADFHGELVVRNALGQLVMSRPMAGGSQQVPITAMAPGLYLVQLIHEAGYPTTLRWLVH
jgi:hypothetical protein